MPETISDPPLTSSTQWRIVGSNPTTGTTADISLANPVKTRFVMVYLTSLPAVDRRLQGGHRRGVGHGMSDSTGSLRS